MHCMQLMQKQGCLLERSSSLMTKNKTQIISFIFGIVLIVSSSLAFSEPVLTLEQAEKIIEGTARSMGIEVK